MPKCSTMLNYGFPTSLKTSRDPKIHTGTSSGPISKEKVFFVVLGSANLLDWPLLVIMYNDSSLSCSFRVPVTLFIHYPSPQINFYSLYCCSRISLSFLTYSPPFLELYVAWSPPMAPVWLLINTVNPIILECRLFFPRIFRSVNLCPFYDVIPT